METIAHFQSLFYLSSTVPIKGALPPGSLHRVPIERERERSAPPPEPLSESPVDEPTTSCPAEPP